MGLLSECVGARGFEAETYFESALRDAQLIPGLEGSTHINFGLTAQFLDNYFAAPGGEELALVVTHEADPDENPYWMAAHDRNAKTVRFAPFREAYRPLRSVPNVRSFLKQVEAFGLFARSGVSAPDPATDAGLLIAVGKCLSAIVYGQLVAENCLAAQVAPSTVSVIFHGLIEDLSSESLKLSAMFPAGSTQRGLLKRVVRVPRTSAADLGSVAECIAARYG
jgi:acyl-CoA dehydrogenase